MTEATTETEAPKFNRKQRRAMKRRYRGQGFTRQYSSKRVIARDGRIQKKAGMSQKQLMDLISKLQAQAAALPEDDDTTEEYSDHVTDLIDADNSTFELIPEAELDAEDTGVLEYVEPEFPSTLTSDIYPPEDCDVIWNAVAKHLPPPTETKSEVVEHLLSGLTAQEDPVQVVDSLTVKEITARITSGDWDAVLTEVQAAETAGKNRAGVLKALSTRIGKVTVQSE